MSEGFRERARRVQARLTGPDAAFVLAASPAPESTRHALGLLERLHGAGVPLAGVVVNRVHLWPGPGPTPACVPEAGRESEARGALAGALSAAGDAEGAELAAGAALVAAEGYAAWVRADAQSTAELASRVERRGGFVRRVPELAGDVHDLDGLSHVAGWLFAPAARAGAPGGAR
jgi:hypothetical protein